MRARPRVEKDPLESAVFFIDRSVGKKIGGALSKAVLKALGRIRGFIASHRRPFIAKIYRDGRLAKLENKKRFRRSSGDGSREKAGVSRPLSQLCHLCLTWYR